MDHEISFEHYYRVLRDISASLRSDTRVNDVLETVVRKSAEALNAKGAFLRILNLETHQLELCASFGSGGLGKRFISRGPISKEHIITDLCRSNKIIVIRDILHDPRIQYPQEAWAEGLRMAIDAPLRIGDDIVGILRLYFTEQREFYEDELNLVILIAEQGSFAIEKAQMIEGQRSRYDQLALQTEKLSALGRLAAGIAHEINNPLAGILLFSSNMLKKVPQDGPLKDGLGVIMQETIRCKRIIQELLEFSRESEPNVALANINDAIERALHILDNELRLRHIQLEKRLSTRMPYILMDKNQVEQVLVNLLLNAIQAIEDQGVIIITSDTVPGENRVRVAISDTGCGIPLENMTKIFEPFFSTKAKGTGLGLAVSYGIIQKHQGRIYATAGPARKGTVFTLEIPMPSDALPKATGGGGNETF
jgi:two-component system, NtrC family, sensor kinase